MTGPVVLFQTFWADACDGWAIDSRARARALRIAGCDVKLYGWPSIDKSEPDAEVLAEVGDMVAPGLPPRADFWLASYTFGGPWMLRELLEALALRRPAALYTMVERSTIAPESAELATRLDSVWLPCRQNIVAFADAGARVERLRRAPIPYFADDPHLALRGKPLHDPVRFLWIGRWEHRKAPDKLVLAFLLAFRPGEASLVLKPTGLPARFGGFPATPELAVGLALGLGRVRSNGWTEDNWRRSISIVTGRLSKADMVRLHAEADVYVSPSRGEGNDLPALAAKLAGNRLVYTPSGGPEDFAGEGDIRVASGRSVPCHPQYEWEEGATYIDYRVENLAAALFRAKEERLENVREFDWPEFEHRAVNAGRTMRDFVEECL